jgi:hypothetical protein
MACRAGTRDWRSTFTGVAEEVAGLPCSSCVIDGEAVGLDEAGWPRFNDLWEARKTAVLYAFGLLVLSCGTGIPWRPARLWWLPPGSHDRPKTNHSKPARALGALARTSERHTIGIQEPAYGKRRFNVTEARHGRTLRAYS